MIIGIIPEQGGSITHLSSTGQDTRFINYYLKHYSDSFQKVYYFSYAKEDLQIPHNCLVINNPGFHRWLYAFLMPVIHKKTFMECDVIRVMQAYGSVPAMISKLLFRKPFVTTYGYDYFKNFKRAGMTFRPYIFELRAILGSKMADKILVTSPTMKKSVESFIQPEKIYFQPNGVDTNLFSHKPAVKSNITKIILYVGRFSPEKNLTLLFHAIRLISDYHILVWLVGSGEQEENIRKLTKELNICVKFLGIIPNHELPSIYNSADIFVLPSLIEGNPKTLLEAMSCGLPCIGTKIPGIEALINHEQNGLLSELNASSLAQNIYRVLSNQQLANQLGKNACQFINDNHNINILMHHEIELLKSIARNH